MAKTQPKKKMSAKNIAAAFLMALLALSLLGFGVEGFGSRTQNVATVGDRNISADAYARALQNELRALQGQVGQAVTMEQARMFGIDQMVLEQLVTSAVLDNEAERLGVSAGDATVQREILQISAFQGLDGNIDREAYRFALQNAGMNEAEFESSIREDVARSILQMSVISGAAAPERIVNPLLEYQAQTRDVTVQSLSADTLPEPVDLPNTAELQAFYEANLDRYTQPEGKRIRYAWITPEMVIDTIEVDEQILRDAYEARRGQFSQPERRLVERLVFSDMDAAEEALARITSGEITFDELVLERGLALEDADMGDVTREQLGAAADVVFDLDEPGIAGPAQTTLGPAIFRMNAILSAQDVSFEDARDQLRDEQLADLARRTLTDDYDLYEDLLAGGATVEQLGQETEMQTGQIDWRPGVTDGIAAYESFRDAAEQLREGEFPEIQFTQDGGMFALEYVETLPAAPRPLEEVEAQVIADWQNEQTLQGLRTVAEQIATSLRDDTDAPELAVAPVRFDGLRRNETLPDLPRNLIDAAFEMDEGEVRIVEGDSRMHVLQLHSIQSPDLMLDDVADMRAGLEMQIEQSIAQDLFDYFSASLRQSTPIRIDQQMIDAVQANF